MEWGTLSTLEGNEIRRGGSKAKEYALPESSRLLRFTGSSFFLRVT
jgi:hypothetical protein